MKTRPSGFMYVLAGLGLLLIGCSLIKAEHTEVPAEKIAYAGHGMLFDKHMQEIKLNASLTAEIQDSMMEEILKEKPNRSKGHGGFRD